MARNEERGWQSYVSLGGIASLGLSALSYLLARHLGTKAHELEAARPLDYLDDIKQVASMLPMVVAVRGRVNSRQPKQCELCDKKAVIHELVEHEIWRKERDNGRTVLEPVEVRRVADQAEWFLEDGSSVTARVDNSLDAARLRGAMEVRSTFKPEDNKNSVAKFIIDKAWNMMKTGVRRTESFLPVGTIVTVVGELGANAIRLPHPLESAGRALSGGGGQHVQHHPYILRKPAHQGPFYITPLTLPQLHASLSGDARRYKYLALGFATLAAVLSIHKAAASFLIGLRARRLRRRIAAADAARKVQLQERAAAARAAAAAARDGGAAVDVEEASAPPLDDRLPDTCVVCMEGSAEMVFVACGHLCCCYDCGHQLNRCPICRVRGASIKVYRP